MSVRTLEHIVVSDDPSWRFNTLEYNNTGYRILVDFLSRYAPSDYALDASARKVFNGWIRRAKDKPRKSYLQRWTINSLSIHKDLAKPFLWEFSQRYPNVLCHSYVFRRHREEICTRTAGRKQRPTLAVNVKVEVQGAKICQNAMEDFLAAMAKQSDEVQKRCVAETKTFFKRMSLRFTDETVTSDIQYNLASYLRSTTHLPKKYLHQLVFTDDEDVWPRVAPRNMAVYYKKCERPFRSSSTIEDLFRKMWKIRGEKEGAPVFLKQRGGNFLKDSSSSFLSWFNGQKRKFLS